MNVTTAIRSARGPGKLRQREEIEGYLLIMPWFIGFVVLVAGPMLASIYLAFSNYDVLTPPVFTGFRNFVQLFTKDPLFWQALKVTTIYTLVGVPLHVVTGFAVAVLLNQNVRGLSFFRTVFYLPSVVSGVAVAMMWIWVFNPELGIINSLLKAVGIQGPGWFASSDWALPTFIITSLWGIGGGIVIYLAGLQGVPTQLYEAAELDGANALRRFWHVTIPMVSPVIFFNLIMGIIGSFQVFTGAYVITAGGPANATLFYVLYLYRNAFQYFQMGYASALAWILFIIIMAATLLMIKLSGRWVYYEGGVKGAG